MFGAVRTATADPRRNGTVRDRLEEVEKLLHLARLAVRRLAPVRAGEPHVVAAWPLDRDGRKHRSAGCLYDAAGTPLAVASVIMPSGATLAQPGSPVAPVGSAAR